ncbi:MAG: exo-alpha-sialidase [Bacteroidales bacterium]|nr:exo-alpha-sialidase [Bacteroidales bacterium]
MKKVLSILVALAASGVWSGAQNVRVHTQEEMNRTPHELNSHAGDESFSSLEPIRRYRRLIKPEELMPSGLPEEQRLPWYPRVKALPNGQFVMFYIGGEVSSRLFSSFSDDLLTWRGRKTLMNPKSVTINGVKDFERYCNMEAVVLRNKTLLGVFAFRATNGYRTGQGCGLMAMRSHDDGQTWTRPNVIYNGPCWEPYALELPDGRVQVYFTDATPWTRNSGTSVIESSDGGVTFGPKKRVSRMFKYFDKGEKIYTDQMPVFRVLNDGRTLFGIVEDRLELDGPGEASSYWISAIYNDGPEWKDLGENSEGPVRRETQVLRSNAGYVVTLPSGEVIISTGVGGKHSVKVGDHTATRWNARNWESDWLQPLDGYGVWGNIEATPDRHHIISTMDTRGGGILFGLSYLNHRISAPLQETLVDGKADEWYGDEALFIGSDSPVETIFRAAHDGSELYLAVECIDEDATEDPVVSLSLCNAGGKLKKGAFVNLSVGSRGLLSASDPSVRATTQRGMSEKGRKGFVCEVALPLSAFGARAGERIYLNATVNGKTGEGKFSDGFWRAGKAPETWQLVTLSEDKVAAPFKASHSGEEQYSVLQPMPAYSCRLEPSFLLKDLPETADEQKFACYPRIKTLKDGSYILFWMGGRFGSRIWCSRSTDGLQWSTPDMLFSPHKVTMPDGKEDVRRYVNPDAVVLPDGDILLVVSFRAHSHYKYGVGSGLMVRRSSDGGRTWSEARQITDVPNWEPYLLCLPDGRIQCYLTHGVPQWWNSGTSVMTSSDGGDTWTQPIRCSRQFKYVYQGHNIYTDQMPCFRVLADGRTLAGFLESRNETKIPLDYKDKDYYASYCKMSMVYNDGFDWKDLGEDSEGPVRRQTNILRGAAGYMVTFPSGEVVVGRTIKSDYQVKVLTSDAETPQGVNWASGWFKALPDPGYWGCLETDGPLTMYVAMHSDKTKGLQLGRYHLNHRIDAAPGRFSDDPLYLGTSDGAEARIRASRTGEELILSVVTKGPVASVDLRLCGLGSKQILRRSLKDGGGELRIPLVETGVSAAGDYICLYALLNSNTESTAFTAAQVANPYTWQRIRLQ